MDRKHIHAIFTLEDGRYLCYHDTRKFGRMYVQEKEENLYDLYPLRHVGYDFMDDRYTPSYLYACIHPLKRNLKSALLDQSIVAGIGNIYADEICFRVGLDPRSRCQKVSKKDCEQIVYYTRHILNGAIQSGGTSIRDYTTSLGITGLFQLQLKVHDQKDKPCPICGQPISKITVSQRGTYLCKTCQKRK